MARPSKLTPKVADAIERDVRAGAYPTTAGRAAGIAERTLYDWLHDERPRFREFRRRIDEAEAQAEIEAVGQVRKLDPKWHLERRHREHWGRPTEAVSQATVVAIDNSARATPADGYQERIVISPGELRTMQLRLARQRGETGEPEAPIPHTTETGELVVSLNEDQLRAASMVFLDRVRVARGLAPSSAEDDERLRSLIVGSSTPGHPAEE
jgi:hypothetical protein